MNLRFSTAVGFLATASLLSGSAFAFAPEFDGDLPTVIITDQLPAPSADFDLAQPGPATSGIFRFTGAFDLYQYIRDQDGNQLTTTQKNQTKWLFTESKEVSETTVLQSTGQGTLKINDADSVGTVPAVIGDFTAAPVLGTDGTLNFWNKDFSGTDTSLAVPPVSPFDYVSDITTPAHDLELSGPQIRIVTLYIAGEDVAASDSFAPLTVVTTINEGDSVSSGFSSGPTTPNPFVTPVIPSTTDFTGWTSFSLNEFAVYHEGSYNFTALTDANRYEGGIGVGGDAYLATTNWIGNPNTTSGITFDNTGGRGARVSGAFAGTNSRTNDKIGLAAQEKNDLIISTVAPNTLYRLRAKIQSLNASDRNSWRIRLGQEGTTGAAIAEVLDSTGTGRPHLKTTASDYYVYLVAKGASNVQMQIALDAYSTGDLAGAAGFRNSSIKVTEYQLDTAVRGDLGSATVVYNVGQSSGDIPALNAGEVVALPNTSLQSFAVGAPSATARPMQTVRLNGTNQPSATTVLGNGALQFALNASASQGSFPRNIAFTGVSSFPEVGWTWAAILEFTGWNGAAPSTPTALAEPGIFTVEEGSLYIADVVMSSPQATGASVVQFPTLRVRWQAASTIADKAVFNLNYTPSAPQAAGLTSSPKAFSSALVPQFFGELSGAQPAHLFVDLYASGLDKSVNAATRNIVIHRIIVTKYEGVQ